MVMQCYLALIQPLLMNERYYELDLKDASALMNKAYRFTIGPSIVMTILGGFIFDIFGRRLTVYYMLLIGGFALVFFPVVAPSHTMYSVLATIVTLMIAPLLTSSPLIQDYVEKDSMAKANAISLMGLSLGKVVALGVLF